MKGAKFLHKIDPRSSYRRYFHGAVVTVGLVLGFVSIESAVAQSVPANNVRLIVDAPAHVRVGEVIPLRLRLEGNVAVGAFEVQLLYDRKAAQYAAFAPALPSGDAGIGLLALPEINGGSAVGYFVCGTTPCLNQRAIYAQDAAEPGLLAEIELLALAAGQLEIKIGAVQVLDSNGQPLVVSVAQPSVVIQVGEGSETFAAPAAEWALVNDDAVSAAEAKVDITQDNAVTHGDVAEVALAWQSVREAGQPCAGLEPNADINGDGCVDIRDVQLVADRALDSAQVATEQPGAASGEGMTPQLIAGTTFTVNTTLDENDINLLDGICLTISGVCSLRAAIQQANVNLGSNVIHFAMPGDEVHTIQLRSRLPALSDLTGGTTIDGYSQPGATPNTDPLVSNAQIRIQIRGEGYDAFDGLPVTSAGNVIRGLSFFNLKRSLWIYGAGASENVVVGNFIGTDATGTFAAELSPDQAHGIHVEQGAARNRIGGVAPEDRNVISGNARHGVGFWHGGTNENLVLNNIVGLSPDGERRLPNRQQGVDINFGASFNRVGGLEPGERNVISGNDVNAAEVSHTEKTRENIIQGNLIGTNVAGTGAPAYASNGGVGVSLHDRVTNNLVTGNIIGNNRSGGILVDSWGNCCTNNNRIENNWIGVTPDGKNIGNSVYGIHIFAPQTQIGPGNVIAHNPVGIRLTGDENHGNTITQNSIYSNTGLGIDIAPFDEVNENGEAGRGPNQGLNFPVLLNVSPNEVQGTACGGCRVEVFIADGQPGQYGAGMTFVGAGEADEDGNFTVAIENVEYGQSLTATATDANGNTSEFSQNVLVEAEEPPNQPPVAVDDQVTTIKGTAVTVDVLANDSDPEGDALKLVAVGNATHGDVSVNGAAAVYVPQADFVGTDHFTYTVADSASNTSVATVTIDVRADTAGTGSAGITFKPSEIVLTPGGPPATYTVVLDSKPSDLVTVTITADAPVVVEPQQLVFGRDNWNRPQVVTVTLAEEVAATITQVFVVQHRVQSADRNYGGLEMATITVSIATAGDEDMPTLFLPVITR
jgi:CSLREA domain-containing protein